jgi:hypothetical protein
MVEVEPHKSVLMNSNSNIDEEYDLYFVNTFHGRKGCRDIPGRTELKKYENIKYSTLTLRNQHIQLLGRGHEIEEYVV